MKAADVRHNAFSENLGTDHIAVNAGGIPIARSTDRASLEHAVAGLDQPVHFFTGSDFTDIKPTAAPVTAALGSIDAAFEKIKAASPDNTAEIEKQQADQAAKVADGTAFDHDGDGKVGGSKPKASTAEAPKPAGKTSRQRKPAGK